MAKKVIVGGRIESKEVGGIVTGAAEILDDSKGKKQSVINQETDTELERLDQSKQDNLTFDNAPTEGSDNPVKSGGLYTAQQAILLAIAAINELIPSAASVLNQLADRAFVNSSVSTNTATFRGTSAAGLNEQQFLAWANGLEHDLNDYVFWQTSDAAGNTLFKRYKWNGTEWAYEYTLNNSTFTAEQWEAIQSGITALLVTKLRALPTAQELIQSFDGKQDVLTFDDVPTLGSTNPVKSSGIYNVIKAIMDLVPAEATAQNQLADKADVAAKIVAAIPSWKGQYDALTDLQAVTGAKAGDMGCVKTTDSDGHAVLTFYQYSAQGAWEVYYTLRHYAQNKPATTGTMGDYPYNGMGRIELQKNIVNDVNTLTQAMLTQQNTIYVIQYDFTLGEDITVPANCVLKFDGGSISGAHTITGANTGIDAGIVKIFNTDVTFAGTWIVSEAYPEWFGAKGDSVTDDTVSVQKVISIFTKINLVSKYKITDTIIINNYGTVLYGNGELIKTNAETTFTLNAILVINYTHVTIKDISISGDVSNNVVGITFENPSYGATIQNILMTDLDYAIYDGNGQPYLLTINKVHCRNCNNAFSFSNNNEKTTIDIKDCWAENCGQAYDFYKVNYANIIGCAADWCNYVKNDNPYGVSFGNLATNKGVYNIVTCKGIVISGCGSENCYGNGVVLANSSDVVINGLVCFNCKSEFVPPYSTYSSWGVGVISTNTEYTSLKINNVYVGGWENTYVTQNYPNKDQGCIACNYSQGAYGNRGVHHILFSGILLNGITKKICGFGYSQNKQVAYDLDLIDMTGIFDVSQYIKLGNCYHYATKAVSSQTSANKLIIPIKSQGGVNTVGVIKIIGCNNSYNDTIPSGFECMVQFSSLLTIQNCSIISKSSDDMSVSVSGMNIVLVLPTSYTALLVQCNVLHSSLVDVDNMSLSS